MRILLIGALAVAALGCGAGRNPTSRADVARLEPARPDNGDQGRNMSELGTIARGREAQLRFCFDEYGRRVNPLLAGKIAVAVTLAPAGTVTAVRVTSRSWTGKGATEVEDCICSRIRTWKFPEYDGGPGTYPLTFIFTQ